MADTTFIKKLIEPYMRETLASWFPGHVFQEQSVALPNGFFKCDAVSGDGSIVAFFLCSRPKTASGNPNTGGLRKALDDVHCLKSLVATKRIIVCTDEGFRKLLMKRSDRFGNEGIEFRHFQLPGDLQGQLNNSLDASSREQRNRNG